MAGARRHSTGAFDLCPAQRALDDVRVGWAEPLTCVHHVTHSTARKGETMIDMRNLHVCNAALFLSLAVSGCSVQSGETESDTGNVQQAVIAKGVGVISPDSFYCTRPTLRRATRVHLAPRAVPPAIRERTLTTGPTLSPSRMAATSAGTCPANRTRTALASIPSRRLPQDNRRPRWTS